MNRAVVRGCVLGIVVCLAGAVNASAQMLLSKGVADPPPLSAPARGDLSGIVNDVQGTPLPGAVVSAVGSATVFAISDLEGRFTFRDLAAGPYLVRAHLKGFATPRGRIAQVNVGGHARVALDLARSATPADPAVLVAGVGGEVRGEVVGVVVGDGVGDGGALKAPVTDQSRAAPRDDESRADVDGEVAWRIRHTRRSVLKDVRDGTMMAAGGEPSMPAPMAGAGQARPDAAGVLAALFADAPLSGQVDLLTTTSFDRPQDLFSTVDGAPRSVALLSLSSPGTDGAWQMRGMLTQGDLSSWILAGSYSRRSTATHRSTAGLSFSMQRYLGGNAEALDAMRDGSRTVGSVYAYDDWRIHPRFSVAYGAKYAHYGYLSDPRLVSPRAAVTVQPIRGDSLKLRTVYSHRETAPGAEEFLPPDAGVWLPPERTFSPLGAGGFVPERLDHVEVAAEREWGAGIVVGVRVFHQDIDDQGAAVFDTPSVNGGSTPDHYHVASVGDFTVQGWGVSVSRSAADRVRASLDYSQFDARRTAAPRDEAAILAVSDSVLRSDERVRDLTATLETIVPVTATRVFVVYRVSTGFAAALADDRPAARFDVQIRQALPFLSFSGTRWEMLVAMRNLFRADALDGSVYDELLVVKAPTRVLGGVTLRF